MGMNGEKADRAKKNLCTALDIGSEMLEAGAEVDRVEDSISRICKAFGAQKVDAFAITYMIIVTISGEGYEGITEMRRIHGFRRNMGKLDALNELSREICGHAIDFGEADERLHRIQKRRNLNLVQFTAIYGLIAGAFSLFFGALWRDVLVSAAVGALVAPADWIFDKSKINRFVSLCVCSVLAGIYSGFFVWMGIGGSVDKINIGVIMIFIPGIIFTSAVQEIFSNNLMTGFTKIVEAIVISIVIATGFMVVNMIF